MNIKKGQANRHYIGSLTIKEFAERVRYSDRQVRRFIKKGQVKASRLEGSRKWLIPESEASRFTSEAEPQLNEIQLTCPVEAQMLQEGDLSVVPKLMALLDKGYHAGENKCPVEELPIPPAQYWNHVLLPSQRKKVLELVERLGWDRDDYLEMMKRNIPGISSDIPRVTHKRNMA